MHVHKCALASGLVCGSGHSHSSKCMCVLTCMHVPVCSRHKLQDKAHRLEGMWDTLVMGSILSGQPILTWRKEQHIHCLIDRSMGRNFCPKHYTNTMSTFVS